MKPLATKLPLLTYGLALLLAAVLLTRGQSDTTSLLIVSSIVMFAVCWSSAAHLLGGRAALHFVLISVVAGWAAEQMGSSYGWFFGSYTYTDVLGPTLGDVPVVIPLMWFALTYIAYVIANLIVWQVPSDGIAPLGQDIAMSLLAAMVVTAYDLAADPYMVYVLKAWDMHMKDGWWFGETVQGFAGWMFVSFVILFGFRLSLRGRAPAAAAPVLRRHVMVPLFIYGANMAFQVVQGYPVETRTVAFFAMGIPLLSALCGYARWQRPPANGGELR